VPGAGGLLDYLKQESGQCVAGSGAGGPSPRGGHPARFAGRTLELAGDQPTPVEAAAAITRATGIPVRYEQLSEEEAAAASPILAETRKRWNEGSHVWHADIEALRVIHPGLRTLADWLSESGAAAIRAHLTAP